MWPIPFFKINITTIAKVHELMHAMKYYIVFLMHHIIHDIK